jgi:carboxyl-terminal processing protease
MPIRCEAVRDSGGIGYLRFNAFVLPVIAASRKLVASLSPRDGLVIDLRGNGGGVVLVASGLSGWLSDRELVLGITNTREGSQKLDVYPQAGAFTGPIAILIDGRSASTSEIMAAGLQEAGRARIFGERSAGAAMPSSFKALPTGDLFQYAVGDVTTPQARAIEGEGVTPDVIVKPARADLAAGRDPALEAARAWLSRERGSR